MILVLTPTFGLLEDWMVPSVGPHVQNALLLESKSAGLIECTLFTYYHFTLSEAIHAPHRPRFLGLYLGIVLGVRVKV